MDQKLLDKCQMFANNRNIIHKTFPGSWDDLAVLSALIYTHENRTADKEYLKEIRKTLRKNSGIFSDFRNDVSLVTIAKMSLAENPEDYFTKAVQVHDMLMIDKLFGTYYRAMSAMMIVDRCKPEDYEHVAQQTREVLKMMKENHFWVTSEEDICYATAIAITGKDPSVLLADAEKCNTILREAFGFHPESIAALSHLLCLNEASPEEKCAKISDVFKQMKADGLKYSKGNVLAALGGLAGIDLPVEEIAAKIVEADAFLKKQKGFGIFGTGGKMRRMYAAIMVMDTYAAGSKDTIDTTMSTVMQIVVEIVMAIIIAAIMASHAVSH